MRSIGCDIPLSSPELDSSIPEVSSTPPSNKELPPVFPAPIDEVEPTSYPAEPNPPTAMTPEQISESSTVHPNTAESVPTAVNLYRSSRVRKTPDRLMLRLCLNSCSIYCFLTTGELSLLKLC
ncbi:hypothetical protein AVEN_165711-1 [Araneus ventricosus]|uniref:Uncharacterized protein n=1 Tax=Araneus ventricosus TaxID=182803 RepID=A0A4Y2C6F1_ARAVE|nr:hypothetical protein AVEN_165711-1 [Araneus ventricosus]